jgi:acetyltransferase-like isoleucine patch superfamily enzyme
MEIINSMIRGVDCGENVRVVQPSNLYECTLGDDVFIGPFVEIQAGVIVGPRTKVQSHSFICELVSIGSDCFIGHGVVFINDLFQHGRPAMGNKQLWKETKIGDNVSIGSNATILPVSICSGCVIGAGAVVVSDIAERGIYVGNPATKIRGL